VRVSPHRERADRTILNAKIGASWTPGSGPWTPRSASWTPGSEAWTWPLAG